MQNPPDKLTLGRAIMLTIENCGAMGTCIFDTNGKPHIEWAPDAEQRIEALMKQPLASFLWHACRDEKILAEALDVMAYSHAQKAPAAEALKRGVGLFFFRIFGITPPKAELKVVLPTHDAGKITRADVDGIQNAPR